MSFGGDGKRFVIPWPHDFRPIDGPNSDGVFGAGQEVRDASRWLDDGLAVDVELLFFQPSELNLVFPDAAALGRLPGQGDAVLAGLLGFDVSRRGDVVAIALNANDFVPRPNFRCLHEHFVLLAQDLYPDKV